MISVVGAYNKLKEGLGKTVLVPYIARKETRQGLQQVLVLLPCRAFRHGAKGCSTTPVLRLRV